MTAVRVGSTINAANTSGLSLALPAGTVAGNIAAIIRAANVASASMTLPSGWIEDDGATYGSSQISVLRRILTSADITAGSVTLATSATTKQAAVIHTLSDFDSSSAFSVGLVGDTSTVTTTQAAPVITGQKDVFCLETFFERSSTPSVSASVSGATSLGTDFTTGGSAVSILAATDDVVSGSVGGDTITWSRSNNVHLAATVGVQSERKGNFGIPIT